MVFSYPAVLPACFIDYRGAKSELADKPKAIVQRCFFAASRNCLAAVEGLFAYMSP